MSDRRGGVARTDRVKSLAHWWDIICFSRKPQGSRRSHRDASRLHRRCGRASQRLLDRAVVRALARSGRQGRNPGRRPLSACEDFGFRRPEAGEADRPQPLRTIRRLSRAGRADHRRRRHDRGHGVRGRRRWSVLAARVHRQHDGLAFGPDPATGGSARRVHHGALCRPRQRDRPDDAAGREDHRR